MLVLRKDRAAEAELCEWVAKGFEVHGAWAEELVAFGGAHCDFAGFADEVFLNPVAHYGRLLVDVWFKEVCRWW